MPRTGAPARLLRDHRHSNPSMQPPEAHCSAQRLLRHDGALTVRGESTEAAAGEAIEVLCVIAQHLRGEVSFDSDVVMRGHGGGHSSKPRRRGSCKLCVHLLRTCLFVFEAHAGRLNHSRTTGPRSGQASDPPHGGAGCRRSAHCVGGELLWGSRSAGRPQRRRMATRYRTLLIVDFCTSGRDHVHGLKGAALL